MKSRKLFQRMIVLALICALLVQVSACGYVLYSERRNQPRGGEIDPAVAILDGLGLLLFIIPGVVAFIVDFSTNAIYFPPGKKASLLGAEKEKLSVVQVPAGQFNPKGIESIVSKHVGETIRFDSAEVKIYALEDIDHLPQEYLRELEN